MRAARAGRIRSDGNDHLRRRQFLRSRGIQQLLIGVATLPQMQPQILRHVDDAGIDRRGRTDVIVVAMSHCVRLTVDGDVRCHDILIGL